MPSRTIIVDGTTWRVSPSGYVTANTLDEFGLIFVAAAAEGGRELRVTRYSPSTTSRTREASLRELTDGDLIELLATSQPGASSPETGYAG